MTLCIKIFVIFLNIVLLDAYRFLIVCPYPVKSLSILGEGYVKLLVDKGHEVTYISPFPVTSVPKTDYRHIDVSENINVLATCRKENLNLKQSIFGFNIEEEEADSTQTISYIMENEINMNDMFFFPNTALRIAASTFLNAEVTDLLRNPHEMFDAVIVDWFQTDIYAGLAALLDCPLIWSYSAGVDWNVLRLVDEPTNPAFSNNYLSSNIPPYTFYQRIQELWTRFKFYFVKWLIMVPKEEKVYDLIFRVPFEIRGVDFPDLQNIVYNASMLLINDHQAIGGIPAISQNVKLIGGFHIDDPVKLLPRDIRFIMDVAKHGVIFFSMGSTWESKDIPKIVINDLLKMFGTLNQTIIWKFEDELTNIPSNVYTFKWAPQQSILAHPNCKLFITHGGILSQIEAIYFGVPTIGVPIYFDQFKNVNKAVANGHSIKVNFSLNLVEDLYIAIKEMFNDTKYRERIKALSMIYHDRPLLPGEESVHWIEHVVKTRGAIHLRSPALMVYWYQKLYLDLIVLIVMALYIAYIMNNVLLVKIKKAIRSKSVKRRKRN